MISEHGGAPVIEATESAFARLHDEVERVRAQARIERHGLEERVKSFRIAARCNGKDAFALEAEVEMLQAERDSLAEELERLRAERDAARRELLEHGHGVSPSGVPVQHVPPWGKRLTLETIGECARSRGWEYLVETRDGGR